MKGFFDQSLEMNAQEAYDNLDYFREFVHKYELPANFPEEMRETWQVMFHHRLLLHWYYSTSATDPFGVVTFADIREAERFMLDSAEDFSVPHYSELLFVYYGSNVDPIGVASGSKRLQIHCKLWRRLAAKDINEQSGHLRQPAIKNSSFAIEPAETSSDSQLGTWYFMSFISILYGMLVHCKMPLPWTIISRFIIVALILIHSISVL